MHPVLAGRVRLALYTAAWVALGALLAIGLAGGGVAWARAYVVTLPLGIVLGFLCLTSFYLCHAVPLRLGAWGRLAGTHVGAATLTASLWVIAGYGWVVLLGAGRLDPEMMGAYRRAAPGLWAVGLLAFLLSSAVHYGLGAFEASRHAEKRALEFELASRDAELKTLRAQIHPHFLFNSLNSINALIARDPDGARRLCVQLADFLRGSLTVGNRLHVRFEQELEMAERLLSIEKVRFGDRLAVGLSVDGAARRWLVPPLILQPLVENAITHGIAHILEGGVVRIEAAVKDGRLEAAVSNPRDAGGGRRKGAGLGLVNVQRRLAALYGDGGALRVLETADGFRVELSLPPPA